MRKKRLFMRKVRRALTGQMFTGTVVSLLASSLVLHHLWVATEMEALHVLAYAAFAGIFCGCGYAILTE